MFVAGQVWSVSTLGGYMYADNLSKKLRMALQPMVKFRQFADIKDAAHQGLHKGQTFHWDVYSDVTTQGTTLLETNTMKETNYTITQGTMTITEYGQAVPYTGKLELLAEHKVTEIIDKVLKNDAMKAFDNAAAAEFNKAALRYVGTSTATGAFTTDGTATSTNTSILNTYHVSEISAYMEERNIPAYEGEDYFCISNPTTLKPLQVELESIQQYTPVGFGMILNGEMGRYHNVRFVKQTNISKSGGIGTDTDGFSSGVSNWAVFFGEDTVAEAIAVPEEIRAKIPSDYGRSKGIAWYYLGGFAYVHNSASGYSPVANERCLIWDSAA